MAYVVSFANQKGGVGKTTICLQMAHFMAEKKKRVLVIDMDPQGNSSTRLADREIDENGIEEYLVEGTTRTLDLFKDVEDLPEITPAKCSNGVDLIWSKESDFELSDIEGADLQIILNVRENVKRIQKMYDYILIDCPPALGRKLLAALAASTHVVCPVRLSGFAISGLGALLETITNVQEHYNDNLRLAGIVVNNMDKSPRNLREYDKLKEQVGSGLLDNMLMQRSPIDHASTDGIPVWKTPYGAVAGEEFKKVLKEIMNKVQEG